MSDLVAYIPELVPQQYWDWITAHVPENAYGLCASMTEQMAAAFPELTRTRGYFYDPQIGLRAHWWLVHPDGYIVDPTAKQFPSHGIGMYEPYDESQPEPIGHCLNCGELCYEREGSDAHQICSPECYRAFAAELNSTR